MTAPASALDSFFLSLTSAPPFFDVVVFEVVVVVEVVVVGVEVVEVVEAEAEVVLPSWPAWPAALALLSAAAAAAAAATPLGGGAGTLMSINGRGGGLGAGCWAGMPGAPCWALDTVSQLPSGCRTTYGWP